MHLARADRDESNPILVGARLGRASAATWAGVLRRELARPRTTQDHCDRRVGARFEPDEAPRKSSLKNAKRAAGALSQQSESTVTAGFRLGSSTNHLGARDWIARRIDHHTADAPGLSRFTDGRNA
jgi:hypothetical protein